MISCFSKFHRKISMNLVGCQVFWRFGTLQDHYIIFKKHWFHFWKHTWFKSVFLRLVSNEKNMMKFADSDVLTFVSTCTDTLMYWQILWRAVSILNPSGRTFETIWVLPAINLMELYNFGMVCFQHKCIDSDVLEPASKGKFKGAPTSIQRLWRVSLDPAEIWIHSAPGEHWWTPEGSLTTFGHPRLHPWRLTWSCFTNRGKRR